MRTIKSVMEQLTNAQAILRDVKDTLRVIDPAYGAEEEKYLRSARILEEEVGSSVSPTAGEYLAAEEQELAACIIYAGWLGLQLNLDCFYNPVNAILLREDHEDILRERRMHRLPAVRQARRCIEAFYEALPGEKKILTDDIIGYYSYLQTSAFKLAHYFGFRLGDEFLYCMVPGYSRDSLITERYARTLEHSLKADLSALV